MAIDALPGVEEENGVVLDLEFDAAGAFVAPRPNAPEIADVVVDNGLTLNLRGVYRTSREKATPTTLKLCVRTPTGSYNWSSPQASGILGAENAQGLRIATLSYAVPAPGLYYLALKAQTAGGVQSADASSEMLVYVSDVDAAAPTVFEFALARS